MPPAKVNNNKIGKIHYYEPELNIGENLKTTITLPPAIQNNPASYFEIMEKLFKYTNPLPEGKTPGITLGWQGDEIPHQIDTNLEPQELLGALASSGLITQEEMISAYKELGLSPQKRAIGNGLSPMDTPNKIPPNLPSFSLF